MSTVLAGFPAPARAAAGMVFPITDRITARWLARAGDPYLSEIHDYARLVGRAGPVTLNLSYEWGCTSQVVESDGAPVLFHTLDWPFEGLGERVEAHIMPGAAGSWISVGWPGVAGVLQATAPGRFAVCLNQAPERQCRFGRLVDWIDGRRRFLSSRAAPPAHLLRQVLETAGSYEEARRRLAETPIAAPVIYVLAGPRPGEGCVIERLEEDAAIRDLAEGPVAAANHFESLDLGRRAWRERGYDSQGRAACAASMAQTPDIEALATPLLNPLTRLAVRLDPAGAVAATGYDAAGPVTQTLRLTRDQTLFEPDEDR